MAIEKGTAFDINMYIGFSHVFKMLIGPYFFVPFSILTIKQMNYIGSIPKNVKSLDFDRKDIYFWKS